MCRVVIPGPLRAAAGGRSLLEVEAEDLPGLLRGLRETCPDLADGILQEDGRLRPHVNLFINGRLHAGKEIGPAPLADDDEVVILPAVSGG